MSKLVDELRAERQRLVKRLAAVDALGALSSPVWNLQFPPSEKEPAEVLAARPTEKREGTADDADYAEGSAGASPHQEQTQTTKVLAGRASKNTKESRDGSATGADVRRKGGNLAAAVRDFLDHEVVDGQEFGLKDVRDYVRRVHPEIPEDKLMGVAVTLTDLRDRGLVDRVGNERPAKYRRCQRKSEPTRKNTEVLAARATEKREVHHRDTENTEVLAGRAIRRMERAGTALPLEAGKVADRYEEFRKGIPGLNGAAAEEEGEVGNP